MNIVFFKYLVVEDYSAWALRVSYTKKNIIIQIVKNKYLTFLFHKYNVNHIVIFKPRNFIHKTSSAYNKLYYYNNTI